METQRVQIALAQARRDLEVALQDELEAEMLLKVQKTATSGRRAAVRVLERRLGQAIMVRPTIN
jgi:hypothetical protein